jgi:hypothetical protein
MTDFTTVTFGADVPTPVMRVTIPEGCTGHVLAETVDDSTLVHMSLQHDGETCPIHEED